MTPYGSFSFFLIVAVLLTPTVIAGLQGKKIQTYNRVISFLILILIFSSSWIGFLSLCLFTVWQIVLIKSYLSYRLKENRALVFYMAVGISILPLVLTKVMPFFAPGTLIGFLGISYLTFKGVQIIIETRDGLIKQDIPVIKLLTFILFFPTISSGPIDRYRRFEKDEQMSCTKDEYQDLLYQGINKLFLGFLYKYIIGYIIHNYWIINLAIISNGNHTLYAIMSMYSYSLYLFFDFAGYSAFAIGVSYILGIKTPENFNKPFLSRNIREFWNRWHMTLSFWFRDYVYMRFIFFMTKKKWIKNRNTVSNLGFLLLFTIMGFWHGLQIQYIAYGLYHASLMIGYNQFDLFNKKKKWWPKNKFTNVMSVIVTFHFVCFGFYIFSGQLFK
jgi:membrane protein involved in D-alanine export